MPFSGLAQEMFPKEECCWDGEGVGGGSGLTPSAPLADGERVGEETDPGRRPVVAQTSVRRRKAEESSESHEEELMVMGELELGSCGKGLVEVVGPSGLPSTQPGRAGCSKPCPTEHVQGWSGHKLSGSAQQPSWWRNPSAPPETCSAALCASCPVPVLL